MASPDKQQKRVQRAKTKARQKRMGKPAQDIVHPVLASPLINQPFDDIDIDLSTFDFDDILENGFDPGDFDELFQTMKAAEAISQLAMCVVFLQYPVLEMVISEQDEENATDFLMSLLISYRAQFYDEDEDSAVLWLESPKFLADYNEASRILIEKNKKETRL